jgi:hypothetical protein
LCFSVNSILKGFKKYEEQFIPAVRSLKHFVMKLAEIGKILLFSLTFSAPRLFKTAVVSVSKKLWCTTYYILQVSFTDMYKYKKIAIWKNIVKMQKNSFSVTA